MKVLFWSNYFPPYAQSLHDWIHNELEKFRFTKNDDIDISPIKIWKIDWRTKLSFRILYFGIKFQGNNESVYRIAQQFNMLDIYNTLKKQCQSNLHFKEGSR